MVNCMRKTTALVIFCLLFAVRALPQAATGFYPMGTFENKGLDTINLGNLNIMAAIPIVEKPGRAGTSFTYTLVYNGLIWYPVGASGSQTWTNVQNWGWQAQTEVLTGYVSRKEVPGECLNGGHFPRLITSGAVYHDAFGGSHAFSGTIIDSSGDCPGDLDTLSNSWSQDGLYKYGNGSYVIADKGGHIINAPVTTNPSPLPYVTTSSIDTNGNTISVDSSGHFTDTLGTTVLSVTGTAPSPVTLTYKDLNHNPQSATISYVQYSVKTYFHCGGIGEASMANVPLVDAVTLADGSVYRFA
jgi:hypothetical protein